MSLTKDPCAWCRAKLYIRSQVLAIYFLFFPSLILSYSIENFLTWHAASLIAFRTKKTEVATFWGKWKSNFYKQVMLSSNAFWQYKVLKQLHLLIEPRRKQVAQGGAKRVSGEVDGYVLTDQWMAVRTMSSLNTALDVLLIWYKLSRCTDPHSRNLNSQAQLGRLWIFCSYRMSVP